MLVTGKLVGLVEPFEWNTMVSNITKWALVNGEMASLSEGPLPFGDMIDCTVMVGSAIIASGVWGPGYIADSNKQTGAKTISLTDTATPKYNQPNNLLYRGMTMNSLGLPEIGTSARKLGVRDNEVIMIEGLVSPGGGGMSVSPDTPLHLPSHRRPSHFGGTSKDPVWAIDRSILESYGLTYRQDTLTHGLIEPLYSMSLEEFRQKLANTHTQWQLILPIEDHCKP